MLAGGGWFEAQIVRLDPADGRKSHRSAEAAVESLRAGSLQVERTL